ncbi:MAG TPA: fused MFS/spermidine synthase [Polyangiaceae bacterium]|nr:fused MFS/spermidine synthase [Polyangiaceae bacterium]
MVSLRLVAALLWGSGFCALFYQTAWQRLFRLSFGASTAASAAVLAIFLGGLGAGALALGRRAQQHERPLFFYGNLELGVALAAALSPFVEGVLGRVYLALGGVTVLGQAGATVVRLLITAVVIGPAAFLMGGTLPAAARAVESDGDRARARLALLYGMNTLGAVTGALIGTFFLFELFGVRLSLFAAVLVNALVGMVARSVGRGAELVREPKAPEGPSSARGRSFAVLGALVAGFVGFAFLLLEIVWYRLLAPILGGTTYTFGLVLAVALAGIGLGGYLYSLRDAERRVTPSDLAVVTALEGVFVALPIALGDRVAFYAILTRPISSLGFPALVFAWFTITLVVVFPAALVSGYQFPMLFALLGSGRERVARHVGVVYAFNTAGALAGSLLGGFVLLPRLTAVGAYRLVAFVLLGLAVVSVGFEWARRNEESRDVARDAVAPRAARSAAAFALVVVGAVLATRSGPSAVFRHLPIGAGRVEFAARTTNQLRAFVVRQNQNVLWQADGVETTVALTRDEQLSFLVDGKCDGAVYADRGTQAGAGLIAALMHPAPQSSLVIGLGTGMTAGFLSAIPGMERVDVAEMEPSILHVARVAAKANYGVLERPNVVVHLGDGRELVLSAKRRYDVIASEPSNPYRAGVASLYTKEFYEAVAEHLEEGGVFLQWVQGYETDTRTVQTVARTLSSVLPSLDAWQTEAGDIVFIAGRKHRVLDVGRLRRRIAEEPFRTALPRTLLVQDLEGLLGRYLASETLVAEIAREPSAETNTDDRNVIEYAFARSVGNTRANLADSLVLRAIKTHQDRPDVVGVVDWERVASLRPRAWSIANDVAPRLPMPTDAARARAAAITAGCRGDVSGVLSTWGSVPHPVEPRDDIERWVLGLAFADANDARATDYADRLAADGFLAEPHVLRARKAIAAGDAATAQAEADASIVAMRNTPFPLCGGVEAVLSLATKLGAAHPEYRARAALELLDAPFAAYIGDDPRRGLAEKLAATSGDAALCVKAMGRHVAEPTWEEAFLVQRLQCLAAAGRPEAERAANDLLEFRASTAGTFDPDPGH